MASRLMITLRRMDISELERIGEIDRSEHVTRTYEVRDGSLQVRDVDVRVPPWSPRGDAAHSVRGKLKEWRPLLEQGGVLIGAFDGRRLVGFVIYRPHLEETIAQLAVLHVSRSHRRQGVGSLLAEEVVMLARADSAKTLYVSAAPSAPTVEFYRAHGFEVTSEPIRRLLELEPEDIHMVLQL
jgi:ribosomal protein S18 acetylase RimI-like enzyme